jgi:hypothetical protein
MKMVLYNTAKMKHKKSQLTAAFLIALVLIVAITLYIMWKYNFFTPIKYHEPVLLIVADKQSRTMIEATSDLVRNQSRLVIATHGWLEGAGWPQDLAFDIYDRVDANNWFCGWFDWRPQAQTINPTDSAKYAKNIAGPLLAEKILKLSPKLEHIHLIGHSAGSYAINEAARIIAKKTKTTIHLTFLDAYVPPFWHSSELADITNDPNICCRAEHYFTRDMTMAVTQQHLVNTVNIDLTEINPGINDHKFPWHWYMGTVTGSYDADKTYKGKKLYYRADNLDYGFARSLEAGEQNWQKSLTLKPNLEPVKLIPE